MLSQHNRLKRADEIATVFRRGQGFQSPFFSAKYLLRLRESSSRLAFSFGKKHLLQAVLRNRLKRTIIRELEKEPDFFSLGMDVVFFLAQPVSLENKEGLQKSVESFLKRVYNKGKLEK